MDMGYEQPLVLPAITTPPPLSHYLLRTQHNTVTSFMCKLLPLPMNEFTSSPFAVITFVSASVIDRNKSVTVTFSTYPFGPSFLETILVSGIHPNLGLDLHCIIDIHCCQLTIMDPDMPSHRLFQWKFRLWSAYILSIDTMSVHTVTDEHLIIYEARSAKRTSVFIGFRKDDCPKCLSTVGFPHLYFDQLCIMHGHIKNTVLTVVHKAITGPKFNSHTSQKKLDWKDWITSEWIQLDNNATKNMFGDPCTAPIGTSIFFWVWLYSIKPHENDCKKVVGVCDGSTRGGKTMVHGTTYTPIPQQIDLRLQIDLSALLDM
jgi:hypothetical protein